jgi:predicted Fe-S protein YdhL (DUF1289 family)
MSEEELLECPDSPCKLICSMERESGFCFGCGRTQDEIAYWSVSSDEKRKQILEELPARMPKLEIILTERRKLRRVNKRRGTKKD